MIRAGDREKVQAPTPPAPAPAAAEGSADGSASAAASSSSGTGSDATSSSADGGGSVMEDPNAWIDAPAVLANSPLEFFADALTIRCVQCAERSEM